MENEDTNLEVKIYGFDYEKEKADRQDTDWQDGGLTHLGAEIPKSMCEEAVGLITASHAWNGTLNGIYYKVQAAINHCWCFWQKALAKYFPTGQLQNLGGEKYNCVPNGFNNEEEKELNYSYQKGLLHQPLIDFFKRRNFFDSEGKIRLSNRVPAIGVGIVKGSGTSLKAMAQWRRDNGIFPQSCLPEDYPMTFEEYYDKSKVTQEILAIGLESKKYLSFNYAIVNGVNNYPPYAGNFKWEIFDNYTDPVDGDFIKKLAPDYIIMDYGYKIILNEILTEETPQPTESQKKNMLKTVQLGNVELKKATDIRIFIQNPVNPKRLIWISDKDGTSEIDWNVMKSENLINPVPEIIPETSLPQYTIVNWNISGDLTNEPNTNPFSSLISAIVSFVAGLFGKGKGKIKYGK